MKKMLSKGTYKDKISTLCIYARDNAKYSLKTVENLLEMVFVQTNIINLKKKNNLQCNNKSKRDSSIAISALKDLFLESLLKNVTTLETI